MLLASCRRPDEDALSISLKKSPPSAVLKPALGTALIFGGDVHHAGLPVERGLRSVFVASFSTRTPSSAADRVNGLQPAATSGSLREYSTDRN